MSPVIAGNREGFPWGRNSPTRPQRISAAALVAAIAVLVLYASFIQSPGRQTDFSTVWYGARMMVQGTDPYPRVGPGLSFEWPYHLLYPATAFVAALPFAWLPEQVAALCFVGLSAFLLAYGVTAKSWHLLPLFASAAFIDSVLAGQWTIILTAALFLPWLGVLVAAKPQTGLPVIGSSISRTALAASVVGALVMLGVTSLFLPSWMGEWLSLVKGADHIISPIATPFGFLAVVVLYRWRSSDAWLVFLTACLPQTFMWYSALVLLAIARTYREACVLSLLSTAGFLAASWAVYAGVPDLARVSWSIYLASTLLPAVIAVLRRPVGSPAWLRLLLDRGEDSSGVAGAGGAS